MNIRCCKPQNEVHLLERVEFGTSKVKLSDLIVSRLRVGKWRYYNEAEMLSNAGIE
jgi:hypothetical protein